MAMGIVWSVDLALAALSTVLTAWVFALYLKRAADLKSSFSHGLAALSGIFFTQSLASIAIYYHFSTRYSLDVAMPIFTLSILGLAGFSVLLWIARQ